MNYTDEFRLDVLKAADGRNDADVAEEFGITRRSIINWRGKRKEIERSVERDDVEKKLEALDGELGAVAEYEKKYLDKLEDLGKLEDRKKVFVSGLEKVMWDHLGRLDGDMKDMNPDVRVRMLKDLNEIREKLSGEPSVIHEYRNKFQMNVMMVVRDMIPDRAEEFLERIKMAEDD